MCWLEVGVPSGGVGLGSMESGPVLLCPASCGPQRVEVTAVKWAD